MANQLKSAFVADLLHVRKAQQKGRAHIFFKKYVAAKRFFSTAEASLLLPLVINAVIHVFSNPRFILDQAKPRPGQARPRPRPRHRSGQVMARPSLGQATPGLGLGLCLGLGLARPGQA